MLCSKQNAILLARCYKHLSQSEGSKSGQKGGKGDSTKIGASVEVRSVATKQAVDLTQENSSANVQKISKQYTTQYTTQ